MVSSPQNNGVSPPPTVEQDQLYDSYAEDEQHSDYTDIIPRKTDKPKERPKAKLNAAEKEAAKIEETKKEAAKKKTAKKKTAKKEAAEQKEANQKAAKRVTEQNLAEQKAAKQKAQHVDNDEFDFMSEDEGKEVSTQPFARSERGSPAAKIPSLSIFAAGKISAQAKTCKQSSKKFSKKGSKVGSKAKAAPRTAHAMAAATADMNDSFAFPAGSDDTSSSQSQTIKKKKAKKSRKKAKQPAARTGNSDEADRARNQSGKRNQPGKRRREESEHCNADFEKNTTADSVPPRLKLARKVKKDEENTQSGGQLAGSQPESEPDEMYTHADDDDMDANMDEPTLSPKQEKSGSESPRSWLAQNKKDTKAANKNSAKKITKDIAQKQKGAATKKRAAEAATAQKEKDAAAKKQASADAAEKKQQQAAAKDAAAQKKKARAQKKVRRLHILLIPRVNVNEHA